MRAAVASRYGPPRVLRVRDIPAPTPRDGEVLIRVRAASLNPLDWKLLKGRPYLARLALGLPGPRNAIPGVDVAGVVEAVGPGVREFAPGDAVFGACRGALAEYVCAPVSAVIHKPDSITFEQAASAPVAGWTALQGLRDHARLRAGETVLVNGAGGGVGTFAVQIARALGARVTGVCSTSKVALVESLGAERVIDYTRDDFTQRPERYDVLFDCVGNHTVGACRGVLNPSGVCVMAGGPPNLWRLLGRAAHALLSSRFASRKFVIFVARRNRNDLAMLATMIGEGAVTPVIDRRYGLTEAAEALQYLAEGRARGKVIVTTG